VEEVEEVREVSEVGEVDRGAAVGEVKEVGEVCRCAASGYRTSNRNLGIGKLEVCFVGLAENRAGQIINSLYFKLNSLILWW
jgi:hypothetical protein